MIEPHDDEAYARHLHYGRPIGPSLAVLRAVRLASLQLLDALSPEEWARCGIHPKLTQYDAEHWLRIYAEHAHIHADQIRAAIGRPDPQLSGMAAATRLQGGPAS